MENVPYGQRLLPQVVDETSERTPNKLYCLIARSADLTQGFREVTVRDVAAAVNYMAWWIERQIGKSQEFEAIAYMASHMFRDVKDPANLTNAAECQGLSDITYIIMELAAVKCGFPLLLPSGRNSKFNNIAIFEQAGCNYLFCSPELKSKASELQAAGIKLFEIPSFDDMLAGNAAHYPYTKSWESAHDDPIFICHTSGSTGIPKIVKINHAIVSHVDNYRQVPVIPGRVNADLAILEGPAPGALYYHSFPMFHVAALAYSIPPFLYDTVAVLAPSHAPPNGKTVVEVMKQLKLRVIPLPPFLWDDVVKNYQQEFLDNASDVEYVCYGGGPLTKATGDFLSSKFRVVGFFASTEVMLVPYFIPEPQDWQYIEMNPAVEGVKMEPVDGDPNQFELTIEKKAGQSYSFYVFDSFPDRQTWRTGDLFQKHPTKNMWTFLGRKDDIIVMNNGEKFDPIAMEGRIQKHVCVTGALVVGNSRDQTALLLEVTDPQSVSVEDVWPVIKEANSESPGHARIYKHMILFAGSEKPLTRAGKGTVIRSLSLKDYEPEITALYKNAKENKYRGVQKPRLKITQESLTQFVRQQVAFQLEVEDFTDQDDVFALGLDSLMATELAQDVASGLKVYMTPEAEKALAPRLVYENRTVQGLSDAISDLLNSDASVQAQNGLLDQEPKRKALVKATVEKHMKGLRTDVKISGSPTQQEKLNVVVTGTTGFLGYYLLHSLLVDPKIGTITCLNRSSQAEEKFYAYHIPRQNSETGTDDATGFSKLRFLQAKFSANKFGLADSDAKRLRDEADVVIHNAWQVDFNLSLHSFETDHISGVRNLIDWSLSSRRNIRIYFLSSIAVLGDWAGEPRDESINEEILPALNLGYAQSKYVSELMLAMAAEKTGLQVSILRAGQICGPLNVPGPIWNQTDWFPSLVKTSRELCCWPDSFGDLEDVNWICADLLADAILNIIHSNTMSPAAGVFHLSNPKAVPWVDLLPVMEKHAGGAAIVPYADWVKKLKAVSLSREAWEKFPALKIRDFFEMMTEKGKGMSFATNAFKTSNACRASKTMREMEPISGEMVDKWLEGWKF